MGLITDLERDEGQADRHLAEALDRCLSRVRAGEAVDAVLGDFPELAGELAPLVAQALALAASRVAPERAPTGLAVGRARFLASAQARAAKAAPVAEIEPGALDDVAVAEALDGALTRLRAGVSAEQSVADQPAWIPVLAPLLATAGQVVSGRVTAAPPPRGLRPGRARFLAAAAELRTARAAAAPGLAARLFGWLGLSGGAEPARRMAMAMLGVVLLLTVSTGAVGVASADALPGDRLYGVKRLGEQVRLVLAVTPDARAAVEVDLSRARAAELSGLATAGRAAEVDWDALFVGVGADGDPDAARLLVSPLGAWSGAAPVALLWADDTRFDLGPLPVQDGPLAALRLLAPGARLHLTVATDDTGVARLIFVQVVGAAQWAELRPEAPVARASSEPATAVPAAPAASATAAPTRPLVTATRALPLQATATVPATATPAPTAEPQAPAPEEWDYLNGVLAAKESDVLWRVGDSGQGGREVEVDVADVRAERRDAALPGYVVKLEGRWVGRDGSRFKANELIQWRSPTCVAESIGNGRILSLVPGVSLTLEGVAGEFLFTPATNVTGTLSEGAAVDMEFQRCDNGRQEILTIGPAAGTALETFQGTIRELDGATGSFTLEELDSGEVFTVHLAPGAGVTGGSGELKVGQVVDVTGRRDTADPSRIEATRVVIRREPQAAPAGPTMGVPGPGELPTPTASALPPDPTPPAGGTTDSR